MFKYTYNKIVNVDKLNNELKVIPNYQYINYMNNTVDCYFSQELSDLTELNNIINNHNPSPNLQKVYEDVVFNAIIFGNSLLAEFAAENILMGITQENMTKTVRQRMSEIINCLQTGSLYDAINEARNIPNEHKDSKYITNERLLKFINKIETYLNISLSSSL